MVGNKGYSVGRACLESNLTLPLQTTRHGKASSFGEQVAFVGPSGNYTHVDGYPRGSRKIQLNLAQNTRQ